MSENPNSLEQSIVLSSKAIERVPPKRDLVRIEEAQQSVQEAVLISGDLSQLTPEERIRYYIQRCKDLNLNPLSRPFDYISMKAPGGGMRLILYANKNCTEQLKQNNNITIEVLKTERTDLGIYCVYVRAKMPVFDANGKLIYERTMDNIGAVMVNGLGGENLANAMMKAHTKADRRVTLAMCGVGLSDETEVDTIQGSRKVDSNIVMPPQEFTDVCYNNQE